MVNVAFIHNFSLVIQIRAQLTYHTVCMANISTTYPKHGTGKLQWNR